MRYDAKCYALAETFLLDENGISKEDLIKHSDKLAAEIQGLIEDYIKYDYRGEPLKLPVNKNWAA